jgi:hypothetical protein
VNGDMCAFLYTGSAAMHSDKLLVFEPEGSKLRKAGAGAYGNSLIAIKRRCAEGTAGAQRLRGWLGRPTPGRGLGLCCTPCKTRGA